MGGQHGVPVVPGQELAGTWPTATSSSGSPVPWTTGATRPIDGAVNSASGSGVPAVPVVGTAVPTAGSGTGTPAPGAGPEGPSGRLSVQWPAAREAAATRSSWRMRAVPTRSE